MGWEKDVNARFINPYNFVKVNDEIDRKPHDEWFGDGEKLTGSIKCCLTLHTPLALPDHNPTASFELGKTSAGKHVAYPFMSLNGTTPFIPGSELRGMVRNVFEAVTNSCMSVFDDSPLTGRSPEPKKPGILKKENGQWMLYDTEMFLINTFGGSNERYYRIVNRGDASVSAIETQKGIYKSTGETVSFNMGSKYMKRGACCGYFAVGLDERDGKFEGVLLLGEEGIARNRHHSHILSTSSDHMRNQRAVEDADCENLEKVLTCYRNEKLNQLYKGKHGGYNDFRLIDAGTPVFYSSVYASDPNSVGQVERFHFAPAMLSREVYYRTLSEVAGDYTPCADKIKREEDTWKTTPKTNIPICQACALFGMAGETSASFGSAVRFSDATPVKGSKFDTKTSTLKELASPKISAGEMYLERPTERYFDRERRQRRIRPNKNARTWNFEYYRRTNEVDRRIVDHVMYTPKLRGRKFYFHNPKAQSDQTGNNQPAVYETQEKTVRNATVELITKATFSFTVYFESISSDQLKKLIWCIAPKDGYRDLCHKLGMGKPLGLGSVKTAVSEVRLRSYNPIEFVYSDMPSKEYSRVSEASDLFMVIDSSGNKKYPPAVNAMLAFLDFNSLDGSIPVTYPIGDNGGMNERTSRTSMQWFVGNKQRNGTGTDPCYEQLLPSVSETIGFGGKEPKPLYGLKKEY